MSYQEEENSCLSSIQRKPKVNASCFITLLPGSEACPILASGKIPVTLVAWWFQPHSFLLVYCSVFLPWYFLFRQEPQLSPNPSLPFVHCLRNEGTDLGADPFPLLSNTPSLVHAAAPVSFYKAKIKIFSRESELFIYSTINTLYGIDTFLGNTCCIFNCN